MRMANWWIALAVGAACASGVQSRPAPQSHGKLLKASPPLSFLPTEPQTVQGLLKQLNGNPKLQQRYANHFHTSRPEVMKFFRTQLVAKALPETRSYSVWMAGADGLKFTRVKTYKKGDRILALKNGTPILSAKCGNPFISHIRYKKVKPSRQSIVKPMTMSRNRRYATVTPYEAAGGFLAESPYELPLDIRFADVPVSMLRNRQMFLPLWWKTGHPHQEVPEPSTLAFLAVGALPLMAMARKKLG